MEYNINKYNTRNHNTLLKSKFNKYERKMLAPNLQTAKIT